MAYLDPTNPADADELLREADHTTYAVKRAGKNGVQVFTPDPPPTTLATAARRSARDRGAPARNVAMAPGAPRVLPGPRA